MKVLISSAWLGGIGGVERNVWSTIRALRHHQVDVVTQREIRSAFTPEPDECRVLTAPRRPPRPWRLWRHVYPTLWRAVEPRLGRFDIYIHYRQGPLLHHVADAKVRAIIPAGKHLGALEDDFDFVLSEALDGARFLTNEKKNVLLPPPVIPTSSRSEPVKALPPAFFLTVFNPYGPIKGLDVLQRVVEDTRLPIVWCFSDRTLSISESVFQHPMVFTIKDPNQAQLRFLYESCTAYVSFSRSEGFGWAIADAFLHNRPVITRNVGVTNFFNEQPGVHIYDSELGLRALLRHTDFGRPTYDTSFLGPERFSKGIERLAGWC